MCWLLVVAVLVVHQTPDHMKLVVAVLVDLEHKLIFQ
jgi:hypothetical protein